MLSAVDIAAIKLAVEICNHPQLKREIFCVPGSVCYSNKIRNESVPKKIWDHLIEEKATIIVEKLYLPKSLHQKIIGTVLTASMRILEWVVYHEDMLGISSNSSFNYLNSTHYNARGLIDTKRATKGLVNDNSLSIKQKYKLALLYSMDEYILTLYTQLTHKNKEELYDSENPSRIKQTDLVKFWSYHLKDDVDKLRSDTDHNLYWLQVAIKSGIKDSVEYCLEKTNLIKDGDSLIYAALETIRNNFKNNKDWIVFSDHRCYDCTDAFVPQDNYIEVIVYLFSKMSEDQQKKFLKKDIKGIGYEDNDPYMYSRVLEYFTKWPYQDYFMKTVRLMWKFLPRSCYGRIIIRLGCLMENVAGDAAYGEEKNYDYRKLLRKFWNESPEHYKRYIFRDNRIISKNGDKYGILKAGKILLFKLYTLQNFTYKDRENIQLILNSATNKEKENIISSAYGKITCIELMKLRRWSILNEFISHCYTCNDKLDKFKRELSFSKQACSVCTNFIANGDWNAVESFIIWSALPEAEVNQLKEKIVFSDYGRCACVKIIADDENFTAFDKVMKWFSPAEGKVSAFLKDILFCSEGMHKCVDLITADQIELANEFVKRCLSSEGEILQYKKDVVNKIGTEVCTRLISDASVKEFFCNISNHRYSLKILFNESKWKEIEMFLTWCFSSEDEINDFKKSLTMKDAEGTPNHLIIMHLRLMLCNKWKDAEILFAWLGLSFQEIRKLKKETILSELGMQWIDTFLQYTDPMIFSEYAGGKWEVMELLLRWCLMDQNDVSEFRNGFENVYGFKRYEDREEVIPEDIRNNLNEFNLLTDELMKNLSQESRRHKEID